MAKDRDYIGKPSKYIDVGGVKHQIEKADAFKFNTDEMSEQDKQDALHGPRPPWQNELSARANALHLQKIRRRERVGASALFIVWLIAAVAFGSLIRWQRDLLLPALGCENVLLVSPPARNLWECR